MLCGLLLLASTALAPQQQAADTRPRRPNILFAIADDWGWPHAGSYGDRVVKTPTFDRLAAEGVRFEAAFVSSPSCTPSRNAILTGQDFFRLGEGADLWSTLAPEHEVFPAMLAAAGYHVGHWRKAWGPGDWTAAGRKVDPAGPGFTSFAAFLDARPKGAPFCFWLGASDPHRPYREGSGEANGIDPGAVSVPPPFPDAPEIRSDIADYYNAVQRFDRDVGEAVELLRSKGELDDTLVVITGDHGWPFPRGKTNLYDLGVRVPLAVRFGSRLRAGTVITDLVTLTDLAPTFLDLAGVDVPAAMTGASLMPMLRGDKGAKARDHVVFGRERHTIAQHDHEGGYPMRAVRTSRYLLIRNFRPDDWPAGWEAPGDRPFRDCDNGPTKTWLIEHRSLFPRAFELCFGKRPALELYDMESDPWQLDDLAADAGHAELRGELEALLDRELVRLADPRHSGEVVPSFDAAPYRGSKR
ncbi:MAG: sulfatase [Planctomycetota bacterium]